jgi:acyl carrier protein
MAEAGLDQAHLVAMAVSNIFGVQADRLTADTAPGDVPGWDSFGRIQVIIELERMLGRELPLREAVAAESIREIALLLARPAGA